MFYSSGQYFYNNPSSRKPKPKVEAKPIQYAFKDEVDYLKQIVDRHDIEIHQCLQATDVNRKDCEQMYQAIDILKHDVQYVKQLANYLYERAESAPSVAKRKRRVTICAGEQRVEVYR